MASGNISSYARVLNGPHQLEKIQTFNELAATRQLLRRRGIMHERKQVPERNKREAIKKQNELGPICREHVDIDKGLAHIITLKVPQ